jgi:serralysin
MRHLPRLVIRFGAVLTAATATAAFLAAPAEAAGTTGVASVSGTKVRFKAGATGNNHVVITRSGRTITINDSRTIKPGKGCKRVKGDKTKVRCTTSKTPTRIRVDLFGGDDTLTNRTNVPMTAFGNDGMDRLYGGSRADSLYGGSGNDQLLGLRGRDWLDGGPGDDALRGDDPAQGAVSADVLLGGSGRDSVSYVQYSAPVTVDLDGRADDGVAGEHDRVGADVEDIEGGGAGDHLTGNTASNFLRGWSGNDVLYGGAGDDVLEDGLGRDRLYGEAGDDDLRAIDNLGTPSPDRVDGGVNGVKGDFCLFNSTDLLIGCEETSTE